VILKLSSLTINIL